MRRNFVPQAYREAERKVFEKQIKPQLWTDELVLYYPLRLEHNLPFKELDERVKASIFRIIEEMYREYKYTS